MGAIRMVDDGGLRCKLVCEKSALFAFISFYRVEKEVLSRLMFILYVSIV